MGKLFSKASYNIGDYTPQQCADDGYFTDNPLTPPNCIRVEDPRSATVGIKRSPIFVEEDDITTEGMVEVSYIQNEGSKENLFIANDDSSDISDSWFPEIDPDEHIDHCYAQSTPMPKKTIDIIEVDKLKRNVCATRSPLSSRNVEESPLRIVQRKYKASLTDAIKKLPPATPPAGRHLDKENIHWMH